MLRQGRFEVVVDRAFEGVVAACASRPDTDGTWIDAEIAESYAALHRAGFAHSVETWQNGELVGGLYGVTLRGAFFGESMFHRVTDASKVALAWLVGPAAGGGGYTLLDIQWVTPHLASLGAGGGASDALSGAARRRHAAGLPFRLTGSRPHGIWRLTVSKHTLRAGAVLAIVSGLATGCDAPDAVRSDFDVAEKSVRELGAAMADGAVTAVDLVAAYLDRIAAFDQRGPALNAMIAINPRAAEGRGRARCRARGGQRARTAATGSRWS